MSSANYSCKYYANLSWHRTGESEFKCGDNAGKLNAHLGMGTAQAAPAGRGVSRESAFPGSYQIICTSMAEAEKFIVPTIDT